MTYNSASTYATLDNLKDRLTDQGYENIADRNSDGFVEAADQSKVEQAIESANLIIDGYIQNVIEPTEARGQSNGFLRDRCVDIACYYAASLGGRDIPETFVAFRDDAVSMLKQIASGRMQVPGMSYPRNTTTGSKTLRIPRSFNPGGR